MDESEEICLVVVVETRRCGGLLILIHMIFDLPLHIVLRIFELANASSQTTHQFRDLFTTKQ